MSQDYWDEQELVVDGRCMSADDFLERYAKRMPVARLCRYLARTESAVRSRIQYLRLTRPQIPWHSPVIQLQHERLTPHEWLQREYPDGDLKVVAETLGTTLNHLYIYAHRQGWKRRIRSDG